jgi:glycosyltransferase involved in cell wall biosynthesis
MLVQSSVLDDARVRREVETLAADGHELTVIGSHPPVEGHAPLPARVYYTSSAPPRTGRSPTAAYRAIRWLLLPEHRVRRQRQFRGKAVEIGASVDFDVVHCHDYPTLASGFELAGRRPVIYDSHECWSGRLRHGRPEPLRRRLQLRDERRLAKRAAAVLTVSQELGDWLEDHLDISPPVLVRNTFPPATPRGSVPDSPGGLVYAGRIGPGRDLATAFSASLPNGFTLTLAGPIQPGFSVPTSVRYRGVLAIDDIPGLLVSDGLALVSLEDTCLNHRLALPNKLFQAIASGIPVVAADLPALRRVVTAYGIGMLYRPGDAVSLARAVQSAIDRFGDLRRNVLEAQEQLSPAADAGRLRAVYRGLKA